MGQRFNYNYLFAILFGLAAVLGNGIAIADDVRLQKVTDLESLGEEARDRNLPILLMFSMNGCPYCVILEQDYLLPMLRSGEYGDKVLIRMVKVDDYASLTDFNGKRIDAEDFPDRYGAYVTPTMVFLNADGKELAQRLVGIGTEGFFAGDIDNAIDLALNRLRAVALR